jgi:DNA-binding transcriptional MerR regulator
MEPDQSQEQNREYSPQELQNILALVTAIKRIRQELRDEGIPIDEYEALLKTKEFLIE